MDRISQTQLPRKGATVGMRRDLSFWHKKDHLHAQVWPKKDLDGGRQAPKKGRGDWTKRDRQVSRKKGRSKAQVWSKKGRSASPRTDPSAQVCSKMDHAQAQVCSKTGQAAVLGPRKGRAKPQKGRGQEQVPKKDVERLLVSEAVVTVQVVHGAEKEGRKNRVVAVVAAREERKNRSPWVVV